MQTATPGDNRSYLEAALNHNLIHKVTGSQASPFDYFPPLTRGLPFH